MDKPTCTQKRPYAVFKRFGAVTTLCLLALGLAACSSTDLPPPPCPSIFIPADGSKLTRFKPGPGRDIIDVLHEETIVGFAHMCEYDIDATGAGEVAVLVAPDIESSRGPADQQGQANFEYFIAITDSDKNVLEKAHFPMVIPFPENMTLVRWQAQEPNVLRIPLKAGQTGEDFRVFIGLQLTRDELEYQRSTR